MAVISLVPHYDGEDLLNGLLEDRNTLQRIYKEIIQDLHFHFHWENAYGLM